MTNHFYAFSHDDGVFVGIGDSKLYHFLTESNPGFHRLYQDVVEAPQTRANIETVLEQLGNLGVTGFFNSIVVSQMVNSEPAKTLFVQAWPKESRPWYNWQKHVGWYGFFRAENPDDLQHVPRVIYKILGPKS